MKNKTQSGFSRGEFQGGNNYRGGYYKTQAPNWSQENTSGKSRSSNWKRSSLPENPLGRDGKILTCRFCGSYRHFQKFCPHNWNNEEKMSNRGDQDVKIIRSNQGEEEIVLLSGFVDSCYFVKEAANSAVLDTACTSTVAGENWFDTYVASLNDDDRGDIKRTHSSKVFKFGGGERLQSLGSYTIPAVMAGKSVKINIGTF